MSIPGDVGLANAARGYRCVQHEPYQYELHHIRRSPEAPLLSFIIALVVAGFIARLLMCPTPWGSP